MFKQDKYAWLGKDTKTCIRRTYLNPLSWVLHRIPKGYEAKAILTSEQCQYLDRFGHPSKGLSKGEIYLTEDLMVSFPLAQDEEVAEGHACIVLKVSSPFRKSNSLAENLKICIHAAATGRNVLLHHIYPVTAEEVAEALARFQVTAVSFRIVEPGEKYLKHDLSGFETFHHSRAKGGLRFIRMVVK